MVTVLLGLKLKSNWDFSERDKAYVETANLTCNFQHILGQHLDMTQLSSFSTSGAERVPKTYYSLGQLNIGNY